MLHLDVFTGYVSIEMDQLNERVCVCATVYLELFAIVTFNEGACMTNSMVFIKKHYTHHIHFAKKMKASQATRERRAKHKLLVSFFALFSLLLPIHTIEWPINENKCSRFIFVKSSR